MQFEEYEIIDSNGQKYIAGEDEHGWFSIVMVELHPVRRHEDSGDHDTVEYEGEECYIRQMGEYPIFSFVGGGADALREALADYVGA